MVGGTRSEPVDLVWHQHLHWEVLLYDPMKFSSEELHQDLLGLDELAFVMFVTNQAYLSLKAFLCPIRAVLQFLAMFLIVFHDSWTSLHHFSYVFLSSFSHVFLSSVDLVRSTWRKKPQNASQRGPQGCQGHVPSFFGEICLWRNSNAAKQYITADGRAAKHQQSCTLSLKEYLVNT